MQPDEEKKLEVAIHEPPSNNIVQGEPLVQDLASTLQVNLQRRKSVFEESFLQAKQRSQLPEISIEAADEEQEMHEHQKCPQDSTVGKQTNLLHETLTFEKNNIVKTPFHKSVYPEILELSNDLSGKGTDLLNNTLDENSILDLEDRSNIVKIQSHKRTPSQGQLEIRLQNNDQEKTDKNQPGEFLDDFTVKDNDRLVITLDENCVKKDEYQGKPLADQSLSNNLNVEENDYVKKAFFITTEVLEPNEQDAASCEADGKETEELQDSDADDEDNLSLEEKIDEMFNFDYLFGETSSVTMECTHDGDKPPADYVDDIINNIGHAPGDNTI